MPEHEWDTAMALAVRVLDSIQHMTNRGQVAGSLRRKRTQVHDIDLLLIPKPLMWPGAIGTHLQKEMDAEITKSGAKLMSVTIEGIQVDLYASNQESWGIHLIRWTGSTANNIWLCKQAHKQGMKLAVSRGLMKDGELIASRTERDVFDALGLPWMAPEERER